MTIGAIGLILGIAVLIVLCVKGLNPVLAALAASVVVILTNGLSFFDSLAAWCGGLGGFVSTYVLFFCLAAVYGEMMKVSGAAESIANALFKIFGAKFAPAATLIVTWILAYGGINVFIVAFAVYPIAMPLFRKANISKNLMPAIFLLGSVVILVCTPGVIAGLMYALSEGLQVPVLSAPIMGVLSMIISLVFGCVYVTFRAKQLAAKGECFEASPKDLAYLENKDGTEKELPPLWASLVPMVVTIVLKFVLLGIGWATMPTSYTTVVVGEVLMVLLQYKYLKGKLIQTVTSGFFSGINPLLLNGAIMGFAAIVNSCASFQVFVDFATYLCEVWNPYLSAIVAINIFSGITGASMSGAQIFADTMAGTYLSYGVNNAALFRILSIASMGLDTLPHCPTFLAMADVCGVTTKKSYGHVFWCTVVFPIVLSLICVVFALLGIV